MRTNIQISLMNLIFTWTRKICNQPQNPSDFFSCCCKFFYPYSLISTITGLTLESKIKNQEFGFLATLERSKRPQHLTPRGALLFSLSSFCLPTPNAGRLSYHSFPAFSSSSLILFFSPTKPRSFPWNFTSPPLAEPLSRHDSFPFGSSFFSLSS